MLLTDCWIGPYIWFRCFLLHMSVYNFFYTFKHKFKLCTFAVFDFQRVICWSRNILCIPLRNAKGTVTHHSVLHIAMCSCSLYASFIFLSLFLSADTITLDTTDCVIIYCVGNTAVMSLKWPSLCRVERKTLHTQPYNHEISAIKTSASSWKYFDSKQNRSWHDIIDQMDFSKEDHSLVECIFYFKI